MSKLWLLVVGIGVFGGCTALADDDFGDDFGPPAQIEEQVIVPQTDRMRGEERIIQYEAALEREQERGVSPDRETTGKEGYGEGLNMDGYPFGAMTEIVDQDQDGIADTDEARLGTNPGNPDTDGDGFADGVEVIRGYNPIAASPGDKVEYSNIKEAERVAQYGVTGVRLVDSGSQDLLVVTGVAPANGLVWLFVFSEEPMLWPARADGTGCFIYSSAAIPEEGSHEVYAAAPTVDGRIEKCLTELHFSG